jgi:Holliday junction resolvasome RuvABC ATP-dependent DNA helicase subunit
VYEPHLFRQALIARTWRGRVATENGRRVLRGGASDGRGDS